LRFLQALDCKERGWEKGENFEYSVCCCNWEDCRILLTFSLGKNTGGKRKEKELSVSALCMFSGICAIEREKKLIVF
jgi:hypothetical protein